MSEEVQIACNQEYYVAKIYGCHDFRHMMEAFGFEVGKKIVALKDADGKLTFSVEGCKRNCTFPKSYLSNLSLVSASDPQCQERIIEELDTVRVALFQTKESYPTTLFGGNASVRYENSTVNVTCLPQVDYIYGDDYANKRFRNLVLAEKTDVFVAVIDFHKLETELVPVVQLMDLGVKIVLVIRGYCDENEDGLHVDLNKMSKYMGIPIALYNEMDETGESREEVMHTIMSAYAGDNSDMRYVHVNYGRQVERHIRMIRRELEGKKGYDFNASSRYMAISLLEEDRIVHSFNTPCHSCNTVKCFVKRHSAVLGKQYNNHVYYVLKQARRSYIDGLLSKVTGVRKSQWNSEKADSVLLHKTWGFPLFLLIIAAIFCATFELGRFPMEWISNGIASFSESLRMSMPGAFGSFVADGLVGGIGAVLALLPNILIFYLLIGILENSGYMSRASYCVDGFMRKLGLQGKSLVPMVLGFGCSIPAIMSARHIESKKDRILATLTIPFLPCAARVPVCLLLVSAFFPKFPALIMFIVYLVGMLLAIAFAKIYSKTLLKNNEYPYVIELASYRKPTLFISLSYMWNRTWEYLKRISGIVVLGAIVVWALAYFPQNVENREDASVVEASVETSTLAKVGMFVEPVFRPLGFDWKMSVEAISGFAGKELAVSTMSMLNRTGEESVDAEGGNANGAVAALAFVFFMLICFPCLGATSAIRKVSGFKWAALSAGVSIVLAWIVAFGVYQIGVLL
ncbi:MAG: ferrous iron transport protein B [Bacteroidales bacterium]|nr:ferrous iron transport protein B [Bacteroidales bacterium]